MPVRTRHDRNVTTVPCDSEVTGVLWCRVVIERHSVCRRIKDTRPPHRDLRVSLLRGRGGRGAGGPTGMAPSPLLACLSCLAVLVLAALAEAVAVAVPRPDVRAVAEAEAGRVRRAPRARDELMAAMNPESFQLGAPSKVAHCKYAPVYGYLSADCSDRKLTGIPRLRQGVEALDMSENKMLIVLNNTFSTIPNLRYLYLNENRIKSVEAGALVMLQYLEVLDLSGNRLTSVPTGLMALPRLRKLYFADNLLQNLDPTFIFASPTLQLLQLAECSLPDLPLGPMPELLHLNVSGNALSTLPLHELSRMCRLQVLDVGNMPSLFEALDMEEACQCPTFVRWSKLRELDLGRGSKVACKNETNSADDPYLPTCNATQVTRSALEMHGRCVIAQQEELRAQVRSWWVIAMAVAAATVVLMAGGLCYCQHRKPEPRHQKVPLVVMTEANGHGNGTANARSRGGGGVTAPDK
ncbi:leucine-rich repeat-containing protein 24 [Thrips palmi]|uniref:Leucine-rich repeat-containing protein 24 n=1 Tax=Thrips palmi TaxID=161013 RepID=A0A6P8ZJI0_THRPL|nr:leucine-rich repeat-containing protein 24 [Thrips palmi]